MSTPTFTVTGTLTMLDNTPHVGSVTITANAVVRDEDSNVVLSGPLEEKLDATGSFSVDLPAADPSLDPSTGLGYTITYRLRSSGRETQTFAALPAGATLDVSTLTGPDALHPITTAKGERGFSAYELAVAHGFVGTEEQWLASLATGGVLDHGALTGLADDDHPQYAKVTALTAEADARVAANNTLSGRVGALEALPGPDVTAADLAAHAADTTAVHGIADTSQLVLTTDTRLSDARTPLVHTVSLISDFTTAVDARVQNIVGAAPAALDTLSELASALGNDASFATTMTTALTGKAAVVHNHPATDISDSTTVGRAVLKAVDAAAARAAIGAGTSSFSGAYADLTGKPTFAIILPPLSIVGAVTVQTGTARLYNDTGATLTITKVRVSAGTAPTGSALIVDVKKNGTTVFPTTAKPQVAATANTGTAVPDTTAFANGDYLTVDVTQVGSTVAGSNLTVLVSVS